MSDHYYFFSVRVLLGLSKSSQLFFVVVGDSAQVDSVVEVDVKRRQGLGGHWFD